MGWPAFFACLAIAGTPALSAAPPRRLVIVKTDAPESSQLFRGLAAMLEARTDLEAIAIERLDLDHELLDRCGGELACLAEVLRSAAAKLPEAAYLLTASARLDGDEGIELALLNLGDKDIAPLTERLPAPNETQPAALERWIQHVFAEALRERLERDGHWEPYGAIAISIEQTGMSIEIDGTPVGDTTAPITVVAEVPVGARKVRVAHEDVEYSSIVKVERGRTSAISPDLSVRTDVLSGSGRTYAFWGSVGTFAAGIGVTAGAMIGAANYPYSRFCFMSTAEHRCDDVGLRYYRVGGETPTTTSYGKGGVPLLPIGAALVSAGTISTVLSLMFDDEDLATWIAPVIGAAVGGSDAAIILAAEYTDQR